MGDKEQIVESWYQDVEQRLNQKMEEIKTEIFDKFEVLVPIGDEESAKGFVEEQKQYYKELYTDDFGQLSVMPFGWKRYQKFVNDCYSIDELIVTNDDIDRRKETITNHTRQFIYGQIVQYMHSLQFDEKSTPLVEQRKGRITINFQQIDRRKNKRLTEIDRRESAALYEVLSDIGWCLGLNIRPKTNVATCIGLYSGFSIGEVSKELDLVTKEDKTKLKRKLIKRLQESLPPEK